MRFFPSLPVHFGWLCRLLREFARFMAATTSLAIIAAVLSRGLYLLAFFLPLKVLILVSSDHSPSYFPFINEANKEFWTHVFVVGIVVCYTGTLLLDGFFSRLTTTIQNAVINSRPKLKLLPNQSAEAESFVGGILKTASQLLFIAMGLISLAFLDYQLTVVLCLLILLELLITDHLLREDDVSRRRWPRLRTLIVKAPVRYARFWMSVDFILGFFLILAPFLLLDSGNITMAILAIIIVRHTLSTSVNLTGNAVRLVRNQAKINALVFDSIPLVKSEKKALHALHETFPPAERERVAREQLATQGIHPHALTVRWADPIVPNVGFLNVVAQSSPISANDADHYQLQIFVARTTRFLHNENLLFDIVKRQQLAAAAAITQFSHAGYECQICDYGTGKPPRIQDWRTNFPALITQIWSVTPPTSLQQVFASSHPDLNSRLNESFLGKLGHAAGSRADQQTMDEFISLLPGIKVRLAHIPSHVHNPDLHRQNSTQDQDGNIRIMSWARWSLEPLGFGLPRHVSESELTAILDQVKQQRKDIPAGTKLEDIRIVSQMARLEALVAKSNYRSAFRFVSRINAIARSSSSSGLPHPRC